MLGCLSGQRFLWDFGCEEGTGGRGEKICVLMFTILIIPYLIFEHL